MSNDLRTQILQILAGQNDWMTLTDLRTALTAPAGSPFTYVIQDDVDQALTELHATREVYLIPESNTKTLTTADQAAALWLGGEYRHLAGLPGIVE